MQKENEPYISTPYDNGKQRITWPDFQTYYLPYLYAGSDKNKETLIKLYVSKNHLYAAGVRLGSVNTRQEIDRNHEEIAAAPEHRRRLFEENRAIIEADAERQRLVPEELNNCRTMALDESKELSADNILSREDMTAIEKYKVDANVIVAKHAEEQATVRHGAEEDTKRLEIQEVEMTKREVEMTKRDIELTKREVELTKREVEKTKQMEAQVRLTELQIESAANETAAMEQSAPLHGVRSRRRRSSETNISRNRRPVDPRPIDAEAYTPAVLDAYFSEHVRGYGGPESISFDAFWKAFDVDPSPFDGVRGRHRQTQRSWLRKALDAMYEIDTLLKGPRPFYKVRREGESE